jgi:hypothetical protein
MLEHLPAWLGHLLSGIHAGHDKLVIADPALTVGEGRITLSSPDFAPGGPMPMRHTEDGEGTSPALAWEGVPADAASLVLVVEDAGSPTPEPLVHTLVYGLLPETKKLPDGAIRAGGGAFKVGKNSFGQTEWLPPDPPTGHGAHDYVFQLFALSTVPQLENGAGRRALVDAMKGKVVASGVLVGRYAREG